MAIPTWTVGEVLTAADVNDWFVPLVALKTADQPVSSTALTADTELSLAVEANASYEFEMFADYEGGTQGSSDLKWDFTLPSGGVLTYTGSYISTGGVTEEGQLFTAGSAHTAGTNGAGNPRALTLRGTLVVGSTAGTVTFEWAQATSSGTATIVHANSRMRLRRIS